MVCLNIKNGHTLVLQIPYEKVLIGTQNPLPNHLQKGAVSMRDTEISIIYQQKNMLPATSGVIGSTHPTQYQQHMKVSGWGFLQNI